MSLGNELKKSLFCARFLILTGKTIGVHMIKEPNTPLSPFVSSDSVLTPLSVSVSCCRFQGNVGKTCLNKTVAVRFLAFLTLAAAPQQS